MTSLKLRDYQRGAIDALFHAWGDGMRRPAVVLPTGAGKTVVFSALVSEWQTRHASRGRRVIVLVHRDELADQAIAKIRAANPGLDVGKVKAESSEVHSDVMVCSVQTISRAKRLREIRQLQDPFGPVGLIITDECHHATSTSYRTVYDAFPDALHAGFTATLARGDGVGLGGVWDDVVYSRSILNLISQGHLVDVRAAEVSVDGLDLSSVKRSQGDYQAADLGAALEESGAQYVIAGAYKEHASDRQGIVFTPTVETAEMTAEALCGSGIRASAISGQTPREDRLSIFEDFRVGRTQVLVNCLVLTEGFDAPWASCAVIARPTQSQPLYIQMVGRVLRPWPDGGKKDALVLNVSGASGQIKTLVDLEPGVANSVQAGESLTEAVEREEKDGNSPIQASHPAFGLTFKEVDLFAASHSAWLATHGGIRFLSAGEFTFFLWPSQDCPGLWDVCGVDKRGRAQRTQHLNLSLEMAMTWGEAEAEGYSPYSMSRKASWRRGKPSEKQLDLARSLGIDPSGLDKSRLSDAISVALESRRLDRYLSRLQ